MTTANLPVRYEASGSVGLVGTRAFRQICSAVASEGGVDLERGNLVAAGNGAALISVNARRPILSIRPRALYNGITNRMFILIEDAGVINNGNNSAYYEVVYGGTLTGASFANTDTTYSGMEADVSATALSGGISIASDYVAGGAQVRGRSLREFSTRYPIALNIAGAHPTSPLTDIITIVATGITGATTLGGTLTWREVR